MRVGSAILVMFALAAAGAAAPALADHAPALVVPGRAGVPVFIDGYDASGSIVYGDYGLYRPGHVPVAIEGPAVIHGHHGSGHYFPSTGRRPRLGRLEIEPRGARGRSSNLDYFRYWSAGSPRGPATVYPPYAPPEVILAPAERTGADQDKRPPVTGRARPTRTPAVGGTRASGSFDR